MTVQQVRIIEYAMQVYMQFINVDCQQKLVLIVQKFLAYLLADFQSPFGVNLTGLEADNEVLGEDCASACSVRPYFFVVTVSLFGIGAAPLRENQSAVIRLFGVGYVFQ